jgi:hypothetical protein
LLPFQHFPKLITTKAQSKAARTVQGNVKYIAFQVAVNVGRYIRTLMPYLDGIIHQA